jgi:hypothetical protein
MRWRQAEIDVLHACAASIFWRLAWKRDARHGRAHGARMPWLPWSDARRRNTTCQLDSCRVRAFRRCRVCERWVCRGHRHGAGNWVRCYRCPAELLAEAWRAEREQLVEERRAAGERCRLVTGAELGRLELLRRWRPPQV